MSPLDHPAPTADAPADINDTGDTDTDRLVRGNTALRALSQWIDTSASYRHLDPETALWRRVTKVAAEAGEAIDALAGYVGENPRKGVTHTLADVEYELLDVATAALGALAHLRGNDPGTDPLGRLVQHVETVTDRAGLTR